MHFSSRMSRAFARCVFLAGTVASPAAIASGDTCPDLPGMPSLHCVATTQGWFYARQAHAATQLAEDAALAADSFLTHFDRAAPRGAVIAAGTGHSISAPARATLQAAGAVWQLPWLDAAQRRDLQRSALQRQLRSQMPEASDADLQSRVDAVMPAASTAPADAADRSALRHEIGHMLLIRAFWGARDDDAAPRPAAPHYGGPGPDWLDELAAVLMESEPMADGRRALLDDEDAAQHLVPLDVFFAKPHPMTARIPELQAESGDGIRVISGETAQRLAGDARWFYAQARGVADFMLAGDGRAGMFGSIAAFLAEGGDMDGWLATHGAQFGLPDSVVALDAAWRQWLAARPLPTDRDATTAG